MRERERERGRVLNIYIYICMENFDLTLMDFEKIFHEFLVFKIFELAELGIKAIG